MAFKTAAQCANLSAEALIKHHQDDAARRASLVKKFLTITLVENAQIRSTRTGSCVAHLYGREQGKQAITRATIWAPDHRPTFLEGLGSLLDAGVTVKLGGYWKKRDWRDSNDDLHEVWEFQAQTIERA